MNNYSIKPLTQDKFAEAVQLVLDAQLDTREEIEHHLEDLDAHIIAVDDGGKIIGVVGWYQDNVNYATEAMGDKFPGKDAYWVGFFAVEESQRGQGIGANLLEKLQDSLSGKGVSQLWVSSVPETESYYQSKGFETVMKGEISGNPKAFMVKRW